MAIDKTTRRAGRAYNRREEKRLTPKMIHEELLVAAQIEYDSWLGIENDFHLESNLFGEDSGWDEDISLDSCPPDNHADNWDIDHGYSSLEYLLDEDVFTPFIEDTWQPDDIYNQEDKGVGQLRWVMESVRPADIRSKDFKWVTLKYTLLSAIVLGGLLSTEFFEGKNALLIGRYGVALHKKLNEFGIEFEAFNGLTEKGWETFKTMEDRAENIPA